MEAGKAFLPGPKEKVLVIRDTYPPPFHRPTEKQVAFWKAAWDPDAEEILFDGAIRSGKQLDLATPIPTPDGWTTMGEIRLGETIFADDGSPCRVTEVHPIDLRPPSRRVVFSDGQEIVACDDHLWLTFTQAERNQAARRTEAFRAVRRDRRQSSAVSRFGVDRSDVKYAVLDPPLGTVRTTAEIAASIEQRHSIVVAGPLQTDAAELPIAPYLLGAWLGDGTSCDGSITSADPDLVAEIEQEGFVVRKQPSNRYGYGVIGLARLLRKAGLRNNKHIPRQYLRASIEQRTALLQGLMDTDGSVEGKAVSFSTTRQDLAEQVAELVRSLGGKPVVTHKCGHYLGAVHLSYRVNWTATGPVFRLHRKLARQHVAVPRSTARNRYIVSCDPVEPVPMRCISVDSRSRLYLAGEGMIPTHNTQAACKLIASWAWHYGGPNWRFVIMRRTYRELEDSTKAAFLRGDGKMPPCCPPELIPRRGYKSKDEMVVLQNGAEILFRSAENAAETEDKLRNVTLAGFFIDQVEELSTAEYFQMYETLLSRCSDPRGPRKALLVANPGPEDHWVYKRFVDENRKEKQTRRVHVSLEENKNNLPASYVRTMNRRKETNPMWYRRFVLGEWGAFGGKRFPVWDAKIHVCEPFVVPPGWEIICAIDYGWANPTAAVWIAIDYEGRWWVIAEHYASEKPVSWHVREMRRIEHDLGVSPSSYWMDPSTWAKRSEYESPALEFADYGLFAARAQNDRLGGWNRLDEMLSENMERDGLPRLQIFNRCENLIREIPNLRIKDGTDDVLKENDHLCLVAGTMVSTPTGATAIEKLRVGDFVETRQGPKQVLAVALTRQAAAVYDVSFSNGVTVTATGNHPFYVVAEGFCPADALRYGDVCVAEHARPAISVVAVEPSGTADVFDITVADAHEFYANGVLVSNSDAVRYALNSRMPEPMAADEDEDLDRREVYAKRLKDRLDISEPLYLGG